MFWGSSLPLFVCIILQSNGLLIHGQSNISAPSTEQKDHDYIYMKQLLHLETTLNSVLLDFASLKLENQHLQQQLKLFEQQQTLLTAQIGAFNHTTKMEITSLKDSLKVFKTENRVLKERLNSMNSSVSAAALLCDENIGSLNSTTTLLLSENIAMKLKLDKLDSKTMYLQQNMTTPDDVRMLEKIITFNLEQTIQENEQEFMKNISGTIKELQWKDHRILLLLSDVDDRTKNVENRTKNVDNRTKTLQYSVTHLENQQLHMKNDVQNVSQSLGLDVTKLKESLLKLQTGAVYTVAFSAGANGVFTQYDAEETVMFQNTLCAVGGGYDRRSGVFTVPKNGLYIIFCNVVGNFTAKIIINGSAKAGLMASYGSYSYNYGYHTGSNLIVQQLQVNDRVWIQTVNRGLNLYPNYQYPDSIFTVVMIKSFEYL